MAFGWSGSKGGIKNKMAMGFSGSKGGIQTKNPLAKQMMLEILKDKFMEVENGNRMVRFKRRN